MLTADSTLDGERFRAFMSTFPSGVAVVTTTATDGTPLGFTCSSLCALSVAPPSLLVCVDSRSSTLAAMRSRGRFAVNLLDGRGQFAAELFSSRTPQRFSRVRWTPTPRWSLPHLVEHTHAVAECALTTTYDGGDHTIVVGRVGTVTSSDEDAATPLLRGMRRYGTWTA